MKDESTITRYRPDPNKPYKPDWSGLDAMTDEEKHAAALSDPDNPPLTEEQLARARRVSPIKALRFRLGFTQEVFAARFQIPLGTLRDWERGAREPDAAAKVLLRVIARNPQAVMQALEEEEDRQLEPVRDPG